MADYVSKYTGSQLENVLDNAIELPAKTQNDRSKALIINSYGNIEWNYVIPLETSNKSNVEGKVLMCVYGSDEHVGIMDWQTVVGVPSTANANDGDILKYSSDTGIYWDSNDSGSGSSFEDSISGEAESRVTFITASNGGGFEWCTVGTAIGTSGAENGYFLQHTSSTDLYWSTIPVSSIDVTGAQAGNAIVYTNDGVAWGDVLMLATAANDQVFQYTSNGGAHWGELNPSLINAHYAAEGSILKVVNGVATWVAP